MEKTALDLYTLQTRLKSSVEGAFPEKVWVKAEISAMKARTGGHCYMELSQSDGQNLVAKSQAIIWSSAFRFLSPYFESVTGMPLQAGINVLVRVQVNFSQLYGFSLIIDDIDPGYTIGDREAEKQETIARLVREGLMERQKSLVMTELPYRFAVISAPDAAGYRDFMRHLHENEFGFTFHTDLIEAVMQGTSAPRSIADAVKSISSSAKPYDAVLILRGGGAKLDLACFDDYEIASAIACCPVPVLTAVGHDQDYHVCDMVSWENVKTPTALADFFLDIYMSEDQKIMSYGSRLKMAFINKISAMNSKIDVLEARISGADPRRILARGYVLVTDAEGVVLKKSEGRKVGDMISVMFSDGVLGCEVKNKKEYGKR